jgi:hypothetical protein
MGECEFNRSGIALAVGQAIEEGAFATDPMSVLTPGGRFQVRWDERGNVTAIGQVGFFAEFLDMAELFQNWVRDCPLAYSSGNAPEVRDVLGTWMLSILDGQWRYAHVASLRGDAVAPDLLGMTRLVGDESLRRGLKLIAPAPKARDTEEQQAQQQAQLKRAEEWMETSLLDSVKHALTTDWILDCDPTVKVLYGHQSGAEIGYNPHKPGRPSHTVHTYWVANLRLVLMVQVQGGKSTSAAHSLPGLKKLILGLPADKRPRLVRGDCAFGTERVMGELEELDQRYLFKLKQSTNVKRLVNRHWPVTGWCAVGQGWEAHEDHLKLDGWTKTRRVVVMRRQVNKDILVETIKRKGAKRNSASNQGTKPQQTRLDLVDLNDPIKVWEYAVLVTNTLYLLDAIGQLYRDRADCENGFDELKNQWGWGGYSTQDIERCNLSAQAVALVYNWWSWYMRLAHPKGRLEAITSRPLLLAAVGRLTEHAGQKRLLLSVTHAAVDQVKALISNVRNGLQHVRATAPQLPDGNRWRALICYIVSKILATNAQSHANATAPPVLLTG